jgi:sugar phosphate isomerase/epimerase
MRLPSRTPAETCVTLDVRKKGIRMNLFYRDNLVAWCIVPFDPLKRGPRERAEMLQRLGIHSLAYDWRDEHIPSFDRELRELEAHGLCMKAFYFRGGWPLNAASVWNDPQRNAGLAFLKRNALHIEVWAKFTGEGAEDVAEAEEKYAAAATRIGVLADAINGLGCRLALYNHGGWGGEPRTMLEIVRRLESKNVGIAYNFHHGHEHLDQMPGAFEAMRPYLTCVILNGMTRGGPMILPVGRGEEDRGILQMIKTSGYAGPIGILSHRVDIDAELALRENLEGLQALLADASPRT